MTHYLSNGLGESADNPSRETMHRFLADLDPADQEHGAAWLAAADGRVLEYNVGGRLVYSLPERAGNTRHMLGVSVERVVELWLLLASGRVAELDAAPWLEGSGVVWTSEQQAALDAALLHADRQFYDSLGAERSVARCKSSDCKRGTIELSVFCRPHHFEQIRGRPCPFLD